MKQGNTGNTKLLFKLMKELGPSGNEINVRNMIKKEMKKYVDKLYADKFGNLICLKKGSGTRIMLAAHMDEIGLMVKKIDHAT